MKITDLKCAIIGGQPTIRLATNEGLSGYGQIEWFKPFIKSHVLLLKEKVVGEDPRNVEQVMLKIRSWGGFKPWGSAVSGIEMALWDLAGKAAGLPLYRLLGGKIRDRVRVYVSGSRSDLHTSYEITPDKISKHLEAAVADSAGFSIIKYGIGFHSPMPFELAGFFMGDARPGPPHLNQGMLTEQGFQHCLNCVEAMVDTLDGKAHLALDCGPGWALSDAIRFGRALEKYPILWLEDLLTGDRSSHVGVAEYKELTQATTTPIHTGEQIYLRQGFRDLIANRAIRIIGPDPMDVGGLAELKWIAEYAQLFGVQIAPHGVFNGVLGMAAMVQVSATLPDNLIAFEYCKPPTEWWPDIVDGMPDNLVVDGHIEVWDSPGIGATLNEEKTKPYLQPEDQDFFN
ncbi:MAG: mandelate racemase/muconate lactonizing enzyme family protein [Saprospiraceae bacterium]|nr:mandelate racemase/muconate lactonizing enzyme family protein [Saprospiraceae bacterium]